MLRSGGAQIAKRVGWAAALKAIAQYVMRVWLLPIELGE
jgi:hypothetical protein